MSETDLPALDGPRVPALSGKAGALVILTHGYGSNGEDLIGLVPHWREALPNAAFISPNAPEPCPGAPGGYQWWGFGGGSDRSAGVRRAAPILDAFIDAELARLGLADDRLALVGFSQGAMMALHVGPRRARQIAGIVGLSGARIDVPDAPVKTHPPVLLVHGDEDPMVPIESLYRARESLERDGFDVQTHVSPGLGHGVDLAGVTLAKRFLGRVLG
ncbi:MAG TPA: prolyl oligopeptidase family serine peptidase [Caulobacteraceae bacterium]|nr:prolyl oligopeptidase family serine peptidase [Caulobacteraceae bacterium]